jgi:hypothetical protein
VLNGNLTLSEIILSISIIVGIDNKYIVLPTLLHLTRHRSPYIRETAILSLYRFDENELVQKRIVELLDDTNNRVRITVKDFLETINNSNL